uniref:putative Ig domain-containing protein n=1 Tax=Pelomonas sp. KK5 TaxID=1855730 RepID=UPI0018EA0B2A
PAPSPNAPAPAPTPGAPPPPTGGGSTAPTPPVGGDNSGGTGTGPVVDPGAGAGTGAQAGDNSPPVQSLTLLSTPTEAAANGGGFVSVLNFEPLVATAGGQLGVALPLNTFTHSDPVAQLSFEARLSNDTPLPSWLSFDGTSMRFTGTPPANAQSIEVVVIARDKNGKEARTKVKINFASKK